MLMKKTTAKINKPTYSTPNRANAIAGPKPTVQRVLMNKTVQKSALKGMAEGAMEGMQSATQGRLMKTTIKKK